MSSPSWTSSESVAPQVTPSRLRASSPSLSWTSEPVESAPALPRRAAIPSRKRRRPAAAGSSRRVGADSPEGTASTVTGQDVANIRACYQIPRSIVLFSPTPDDRVTSSRPGRTAIYEVCLKLGLRLPVHPFIVNLLDYYSLTPSQLVPNSIRTICAFIILCFLHHIPPRLSLFRAFYTLRSQLGWWVFQPRPGRVLRLSLPSSVKGWKSRFFFANLDRVRSEWGDPDLRPNSHPSVLSSDRAALELLLLADLPTCAELLSEENLRLAGVSALGGE